MNLGDKILEMRTKANMSQGDLAELMNVSRQSVSKWETNSSVPELNKIVKMSEIFKISVDELVCGDKIKAEDELKDRTNEKQDRASKRKTLVGGSLLITGAIIFVLLAVLSDVLSAVVLAWPFILTGCISLIVRKHVILWNSWALYIIFYLYLTYATGIRPWWIFHIWLYQSKLVIHGLIAWSMAIVLIVLIVSTYRVIKTYRKQER